MASRAGSGQYAGVAVAGRLGRWLGPLLGEAQTTVLMGDRIFLRPPRLGDFDGWARLRDGSRGFLAPWEPTWPEDALSRPAFRRRLASYTLDWRKDTGYNFFVFRRSDNALVGGIGLANLRRGVVQSASLGYWMGAPFAGQGHMTEALGATLGFAFDRLGLHRLDAACLPNNAASRRLLGKCGFREEGYARKYLCINGVWQDHVLFGLLAEDWRPRR